MSFVDFSELKKCVSIEDAVKLLGLQAKPINNQLRGPCPHCKSGGDRTLVITPSKNAFYCFTEKKGGDQIALVAHILDLSVKDAAVELANRAGIGTGTSSTNTHTGQTVPESEDSQRGARTLQPLSYLEHEHDAVIAVGFDTEVAKQLGIGYAGKGIMRGTVAVPIRNEKGQLLGYIGITEAKLPADFTCNVVAFPKSA